MVIKWIYRSDNSHISFDSGLMRTARVRPVFYWSCNRLYKFKILYALIGVTVSVNLLLWFMFMFMFLFFFFFLIFRLFLYIYWSFCGVATKLRSCSCSCNLYKIHVQADVDLHSTSFRSGLLNSKWEMYISMGYWAYSSREWIFFGAPIWNAYSIACLLSCLNHKCTKYMYKKLKKKKNIWAAWNEFTPHRNNLCILNAQMMSLNCNDSHRLVLNIFLAFLSYIALFIIIYIFLWISISVKFIQRLSFK